MCVKWTSRSAKIETDSTCSRLSSVSCEVQNCTNCLFEFGRCCDMYVASSDRRHSLCDHRPVACLLAWWKNAIAWNQFSSRRVSHARSNTKPATAFIITRILQTTYTRLLFRYTLQTQSHTHTHTAEMIVKHSNETLETADWCFDVVVAVANHPPAFTRTHTHTMYPARRVSVAALTLYTWKTQLKCWRRRQRYSFLLLLLLPPLLLYVVAYAA